MAQQPRITAATIAKAMDTPAVRAALRAKARRVLPRAQLLAIQAGAGQFGEALQIEEGTRPGSRAGGFKRPYARVSAQVTDDMKSADAGAKMSRTSILRRSSGA